ncbi:hypothetical protein F4604DRAFT_1905292 [Suillus subluteus]|nr:hypothetical protein F4604DRAFT_1905292 [Suillus subluteus]
MRSFSTLALLLPAVLAAPLKSATHHQQHSSSCVIAGLTYPDPRHTLVLLGRRELHPPTGLSERAFTDFLLFCHESGGRSFSSSHVARQQGSYLSNALGDPAGSDSMLAMIRSTSSSNASSSPSTTPATTTSPGSDSMLDTTTPGDAPQPPASGDQRDQSASSSTASSSPSTTSATTTSPTPSPSETPGSAAGPTSTGTPAGNETPETLANPVGSPPSGDTAAITPADNDASHDPNLSETPLAQSDSSAFDTPFTTTPQGVTAGFSSSFVDSNESDSFGDIGQQY